MPMACQVIGCHGCGSCLRSTKANDHCGSLRLTTVSLVSSPKRYYPNPLPHTHTPPQHISIRAFPSFNDIDTMQPQEHSKRTPIYHSPNTRRSITLQTHTDLSPPPSVCHFLCPAWRYLCLLHNALIEYAIAVVYIIWGGGLALPGSTGWAVRLVSPAGAGDSAEQQGGGGGV